MKVKHYNIVVIGGGPAGTSAAFHAAKLGLRTILFEKRAFPRDKPCGGALTVRVMPYLGTHAKKAINCEVTELRLFAPSFKYFKYHRLRAHFVLRKEFDEAMAKDAQDAGAEVVDNCRVKSVTPLDSGGYRVETSGTTVTAEYIIMASGFQKKALSKPLLEREEFEDDYMAMTAVSETPIDNKALKTVGVDNPILGIFFGAVPNGYGWYFAKNGYLNIGVGATHKLIKDVGVGTVYQQFVDNLREQGVLPRDLELEKEKAFPLPFKRTAKQTVFGNVLLVGDSAGFVSPVTGEGLFYAIKAGKMAADAIHMNVEKGTPLSVYQENWFKDFGRNFNKYGYFIQKTIYKTRGRMELAVALGRYDLKMAAVLNDLISGMIPYRKALRVMLLRMPLAFLKMVFKVKPEWSDSCGD